MQTSAIGSGLSRVPVEGDQGFDWEEVGLKSQVCQAVFGWKQGLHIDRS